MKHSKVVSRAHDLFREIDQAHEDSDSSTAVKAFKQLKCLITDLKMQAFSDRQEQETRQLIQRFERMNKSLIPHRVRHDDSWYFKLNSEMFPRGFILARFNILGTHLLLQSQHCLIVIDIEQRVSRHIPTPNTCDHRFSVGSKVAVLNYRTPDYTYYTREINIEDGSFTETEHKSNVVLHISPSDRYVLQTDMHHDHSTVTVWDRIKRETIIDSFVGGTMFHAHWSPDESVVAIKECTIDLKSRVVRPNSLVYVHGIHNNKIVVLDDFTIRVFDMESHLISEFKVRRNFDWWEQSVSVRISLCGHYLYVFGTFTRIYDVYTGEKLYSRKNEGHICNVSLYGNKVCREKNGIVQVYTEFDRCNW